MVFVAHGVYHEAVVVRTPSLTIRGEDRNGTVLDGQSKLGNAFLARADNVVIENLTAHHYLANGFYWSGVSGYRGSYLTAFDNGATASTPTAQRMASSTTTTSREIRAPDSTSASASHATPSSHRSGPN
jgi:pectin methylesterase-like acyl-CoA thioesterase